MKKLILASALFLFSNAFAEYSPATSGFQFLKMQVGARAAGMAGAFLAVPGDVSSLYYNPAGIALLLEKSASFSYHDDLLDFNSGFIGYVHPKVGPGNLGGAVLYRDYGNMDRMDISGQNIGTFDANSVSLSGSYGYKLRKNIYVGGSLKYIRAVIDNYSSDAIALDAGAMYVIPSQRLVFAAGLFNVGATLSAFITEKHKLPLHYRLGLSKRLAHLPLLIGLNVYKYNDEPFYVALGGEFTLTPNLFLRLGYDTFGRDLGVDSSKDTFAGAAIGLGVLWHDFQFDYAFTSMGALGSLNRFSISGHF